MAKDKLYGAPCTPEDFEQTRKELEERKTDQQKEAQNKNQSPKRKIDPGGADL